MLVGIHLHFPRKLWLHNIYSRWSRTELWSKLLPAQSAHRVAYIVSCWLPILKIQIEIEKDYFFLLSLFQRSSSSSIRSRNSQSFHLLYVASIVAIGNFFSSFEKKNSRWCWIWFSSKKTRKKISSAFFLSFVLSSLVTFTYARPCYNNLQFRSLH